MDKNTVSNEKECNAILYDKSLPHHGDHQHPSNTEGFGQNECAGIGLKEGIGQEEVEYDFFIDCSDSQLVVNGEIMEEQLPYINGNSG